MAFDPQFTLANLLDAETNTTTILEILVTSLGGVGFPVTDWNDGGVALTILKADATQFADTNATVAALAGSGFIGLAPGNPAGTAPQNLSANTWLGLKADSDFSETYEPAVFGQYLVQFTVAGGRGPYVIPANGLWISDAPGQHKLQSTNASPVTITSDSPTSFVMQAEAVGTPYNEAFSIIGTAVVLITSFLGVTAITIDTGSGSATVTSGAYLESDNSLRSRCQTKWSRLAVVSVDDTINNAAKSTISTHGQVTSVLVDDQNPDGPGTFRVYVATQAGVAPSGLVTDVDATLQPIKPPTSILTTQSASADPRSLTGVVFYLSSVYASAGAAQDALDQEISVFQSTIQIGDGAGGGAVEFSVLVAALQNVNGIHHIDFTSPTGDTVPTKGQIVVLSNASAFLYAPVSG